jgi:hypothetical protein
MLPKLPFTFAASGRGQSKAVADAHRALHVVSEARRKHLIVLSKQKYGAALDGLLLGVSANAAAHLAAASDNARMRPLADLAKSVSVLEGDGGAGVGQDAVALKAQTPRQIGDEPGLSVQAHLARGVYKEIGPAPRCNNAYRPLVPVQDQLGRLHVLVLARRIDQQEGHIARPRHGGLAGSELDEGVRAASVQVDIDLPGRRRGELNDE